MKKTTMIILCAGLFGLACLSTSSGASVPGKVLPAQVSSWTHAGESSGSSAKFAPTVSSAAAVCARVVAAESLHLRFAPSTSSAALLYLRNGDVVIVRDGRDSAWWMVSLGDVVGYARAEYLKIEECSDGYK